MYNKSTCLSELVRFKPITESANWVNSPSFLRVTQFITTLCHCFKLTFILFYVKSCMCDQVRTCYYMVNYIFNCPRQQYGPPPPPTLQAANNTPDVHPRRQSGPLLHPTPQTVNDTPSRPPPTLSRASNAPEVHPRHQSTPPPPPNLQTVNVAPDQRPNDHPFREPSLQSTHL